jgi:hypothetical protein
MKYTLIYKNYEPMEIDKKIVLWALLRDLTGKTTKELRNEISESRTRHYKGGRLDYEIWEQHFVESTLKYEQIKYI